MEDEEAGTDTDLTTGGGTNFDRMDSMPIFFTLCGALLMEVIRPPRPWAL